MITLGQIRIRIDPDKRREPWDPVPDIRRRAASMLGINRSEIKGINLVRHAIDARKKPELYDVCTADIELDASAEQRILARGIRGAVKKHETAGFLMPDRGDKKLDFGPVVVGAGPAGLYAAYELAAAGYRPLLIERGDDTKKRGEAVRRYWETGELDTESNIQFGAGGAGAYSDGKLTAGIKDRDGVCGEVLRLLVEAGAPDDILTEAWPHVGTDILGKVVANLLEKIRTLGGEVLFRTRLIEISRDHAGRVDGIVTSAGDIKAGAVILATGHSARDTVTRLSGQGVIMTPKAFAVGFRVAHRQEIIDVAQYGMPSGVVLPPANYKLTARTAGGRGVYSFCMCPGGRIVDASSESGRLCVNGMSRRDRSDEYANSAIVVTVTPDDYGDGTDPLRGMFFQRRLEERAFETGKGRIPFSDYASFASAAGVRPRGAGTDISDETAEKVFCGRAAKADLSGILGRELNVSIAEAMSDFGRKIRGYDDASAIIAGVESRTSSPVRIERGEDGEAVDIPGLYPCGEGAGYAGGIVSAAADGVRTAAKIIGRYSPA